MRTIRILLLVLLLAPAISQAKTLEDLLVEKGVITKGEAGSAGGGGVNWSWNNGTRADHLAQGFTATSAVFVQTRYTYTDNEDGIPNTSTFDVERARIVLSGTAVNNEFSYYLQPEFAGESSHLLDAVIAWHACDWVTIKTGQYKTGISRQYNTSDWKTQFPDRSIASDTFNLGRQQGASAWTDWNEGQIKLGAGIFNGESTGEGLNASGVDTNHTGVVNLRFNVMGEMDAYAEGDVDYTEDTAVNIGAAYAFSDATGDAFGAGAEDFSKDTISVDVNVKNQGWSFHGEFFTASLEGDDSDAQSEPTGFYAQLGYFIEPKTLEIAARYSFVDCDDGTASVFGDVCTRADGASTDNTNEVTVALNHYWWKHNLKGSVAYSLVNKDPSGDGDGENTNRWLLQLSAYA